MRHAKASLSTLSVPCSQAAAVAEKDEKEEDEKEGAGEGEVAIPASMSVEGDEEEEESSGGGGFFSNDEDFSPEPGFVDEVRRVRLFVVLSRLLLFLAVVAIHHRPMLLLVPYLSGLDIGLVLIILSLTMSLAKRDSIRSAH